MAYGSLNSMIGEQTINVRLYFPQFWKMTVSVIYDVTLNGWGLRTIIILNKNELQEGKNRDVN